MKEKDFKNKSSIGIFLSYFKPHKKLFFVDMACALSVALIDLAFPYVSRGAMNRLLPEAKFGAFFAVMAVMVAAYILRSFMEYIIGYWGHTFGIRVEADIRRDLFSHMQQLSFRYYDKNRTGKLMSRMTTDLFDITELAHHGPENLLVSAVTIVGALVVMFSIQWRLALVIAVMLPIFIVAVIAFRRNMTESSRAVKAKTGAINAELESSLSGMRTAKAFANESEELDKFTRANDTYKGAKRSFHKSMGKFTAVLELCMSLLTVAVIAGGGYLYMQGKMDFVDIITFSLYTSTFATPVRKLMQFTELFAAGFAGFNRFVEVMRMEPDLKDAPHAEELECVRGEIALKGVSFAYGEDAVLRDVSVHIAAGETVAVVGPSGGGKTTLCQLIPRFYDVDEGSVCVDGKDVRSVTQQSLRRQIGIVQQDVFLFAASILENIRYGRPDATYEEVVEAAKRAEIYDDIMDMPDGFETNVGERGVRLSGGQKQRISIARIFLKNPPILILDEATSALDSVTESRIQRSFDELALGRTCLVIAHRLSTVRNAHRVLVVEEGRIRDEGTHEELLRRGGEYAKLYELQMTGHE